MRIILVQAEIELAIRAYVLNQITVKDGQDITIDFKNTRGDDGATAEINISHLAPAQTAPQKPTTTYRSRSASETKGEPEKAPEQPQEAKVEQEVGETTEDPTETSPAPAVEADSDTTASEEEAPVQDASTTSEPEDGNQKEKEPVSQPASFLKEPAKADPDVAPAPSKSLFANLTKPVNPKPE